jgi:hypothetical protein
MWRSCIGGMAQFLPIDPSIPIYSAGFPAEILVLCLSFTGILAIRDFIAKLLVVRIETTPIGTYLVRENLR